MSGWAQRAAERAEDEARDTRCHACDRRLATAADYLTEACPVCDAGDPCPPHDALCWSSFGTRCTAIDWRGRALAAEALLGAAARGELPRCRWRQWCGALATKRLGGEGDGFAVCDGCFGSREHEPNDAHWHDLPHAAALRAAMAAKGGAA